MSKFVIVQHNWFMDSMGFSTRVIEAESLSVAQAVAEADAFRTQSTFRKTACKVIPLEDGQTVARSRKLSLWERITGEIS